MENPAALTLPGSGLVGVGSQNGESGFDSVLFGEEIQRLMTVPPENASSFTALLELPATQAMELLHHVPDSDGAPNMAKVSGESLHKPYSLHHQNSFGSNLTFLSNPALIERAAKFSVFAGEHSPATSSVPSNSSANLEKVKSEPPETDSNPNSSQPLVSDPMVEEEEKNQRPSSVKRKEREKKVYNKSIEKTLKKNPQN